MFRHIIKQTTKWLKPQLRFHPNFSKESTFDFALFPRSSACVCCVSSHRSAECLKNQGNKKYSRYWTRGSLRSLHSHSTFSEKNLENLIILESWSNNIDPFGELSMKGSFRVNIEPINPHEYPEMNMAFVTIYAETERSKELEENRSILETDISLEDMGRKLRILGKQHNLQPLRCVIQLPIKFGIQVDLHGDGDVNVADMESSEVRINTEAGHCELSSIRAGSVRVQSEGGNINCHKSLQGNVYLKTSVDGEISADKIQGSHVKLQTDRGKLKAQSVYADNSSFWSTTGTVHLGSCHGNTVVTVYHGDITVDSLDGDLKAMVKTDGNIDAYLARPGDLAEINVGRGDITLRLPESVQTGIEMKGDSVQIDKSFKNTNLSETKDENFTVYTGTIGETLNSWVKATTCKGQVTLQCTDWLSAAMSKSQTWKT